MYQLSFLKSSFGLSACLVMMADAQVIFSESFELPVVSGFDDNTVPESGWVGAGNGFGSGNRGLYNETVAWPAVPKFSTAFGDQAYMLNYTNSGLSTSQGAIAQTFAANVPYTVSFNAAVQAGTASGGYIVELVAFGPLDDNNARKDAQGTRPGTVLATATGTVTTNDMSETGSVSVTLEAGDASLGKDIGIRLIKGSNSVLYDNVRLVVGHDLAPSPADGVTISGGNIELTWTNMSPNVGANVFVDVWFGTDPVSDFAKVVDGGTNVSTVTVNAPVAGSYYWRVDSYLEGDTNGAPVEGSVFAFHIVDTDNDGFPDSYESANTNPSSNTGLNPEDDLENGGAGDGLTNLQEFQYGTDPNDADSDDDNLEDGAEIAGAGLRPATNPLDPDTDNDGLNDDVESNTGVWVSEADTGTNPADSDYDKDGLKDGVETKTGVFVDRANTGTDPYLPDTDNDGAYDWYEVVATFTSPLDPSEKPDVPYPLPDPDGSTGVTDKPVKIYIMAGQSNTVGIGYVNGSAPGSLETAAKRENKFPNLVDGSNNWTERNDVWYEGVVTATAKKWLTVGCGSGNDRMGPELGFGHVMGYFHDEPVIIIKASQGNRSLGWDFLPPGSTRFDLDGNTYAGYQDTSLKWPTGTEPVPVDWYAGKQYDDCFIEAHAVLDNFATKFPQYAAQGYEIAGFVWWQGHKDQYDVGHYSRYEENLTNLIGALRTEFDAPNAPVVVGTIGFGGGNYEPGTPYKEIYDAQLAVGDPAQHPEFSGTVKSVDTTKYWRELAESPGNQDFHYNNNGETYMLVGDALGRAMLDLQDDITPPGPGPLTFTIEPTAVNSTTIGMIATVANDPSGPVEYYFENTTNGNNSGWITALSWNNSGLAAGSYDYRVKARDAKGNETEWSAVFAASPGSDVTGPSPDPLSFAVLPTALGESSITMEALGAIDINGVEYFFECSTPGGNSSGWQDENTYTDTGLEPGTQYSYRVRARDKSSGQNLAGFSSPAAATTSAPDLTKPAIATLSPLHESEGVAVDANLVVIFDEEVAVGSGTILLKNLTAASEVSIDISDGSQVAISGAILTINPASNLAEASVYAVQIGGAAISDLAGNTFAGIANDTIWSFETILPPPAGLLFSENFEDPDVDAAAGSGNTNKTLPAEGNWVGSGQGFGSDRRGITDKASGHFSAADPNMQAFAFRYTNSGLTSAEGVIGALSAGVTYTVTVDVVRDDGGNAGTPYSMQLIAFAPEAPRNDCRSTPAGSRVLASAAGNAPDTGAWETVSFEFTPEAGDPDLGKDLGIRFLGATTSAIIDNVRISTAGGGNTFANWIAGYTGLGGLTGFDDDADGDGLSNGLENYLGTHPGVFDPGLLSNALDGNSFTFSHPLSATPAEDIVAQYKWSLDLENFHNDGETVEGVGVSFAQGVRSEGAVMVMATIAGPVPQKIFVTLSVSQP